MFKPKGCRYWYVRYYSNEYRTTRSGRRTKVITESSRSTKRSVAERLLRDRLTRKDRGEVVLDPRRVTFGDLEAMILSNYEVKGQGTARVKVSLKHLRAFFGRDRALDITSDRWDAYTNRRRRQGAADSTIMSERAALNRMFTLAIRAGRLSSKPHLSALTLDNVREEVLDDDDVSAILEELPEDIRGAITFGALTGWRVHSEVLPLTWDRVDLEAGVIRWVVGTTKNRAGRVLTYDALPELTDLIRRWREITDATERERARRIPWVFHRHGRPIKTKRFYKEWHAAVKRAAYEERGNLRVVVRPNLVERTDPETGKVIRPIPHDLRRAAVMRFERAGVPRSVATSITGHKTESVYTRYAISREQEQREGLSRVARQLRVRNEEKRKRRSAS